MHHLGNMSLTAVAVAALVAVASAASGVFAAFVASESFPAPYGM